MKQYEAVIQTLEKLGGVATLGQLNQEVFKIKDCEWKTKTPFASIRRIVQENENIYKIKPGLWALKSYQKELEDKGIVVETEKNKDSVITIMNLNKEEKLKAEVKVKKMNKKRYLLKINGKSDPTIKRGKIIVELEPNEVHVFVYSKERI